MRVLGWVVLAIIGAAGCQKKVGGAAAGSTETAPRWFAREGQARRVAGRVTFEGKGVGGATVTLTSVLSESGLAKATVLTTAADGAFDLGTRPAGLYHLAAQAPGKTAAMARLDLRDPSTSAELELALLGCGAHVQGHVVDEAGRPVPGAAVAVWSRRAPDLSRDRAATSTAADGSYDLCVPPGAVGLEVTAPGRASVLVEVLAYGVATREVVLRPEAVLTGRVVEEGSERPVAGALVWASGGQTRTDSPALTTSGADGRFAFHGLEPGGYGVNAQADGFRSFHSTYGIAAEAVLATPELVVEATPTATVRGKVETRDGGPVGVELCAVASDDLTECFARAFAAADGTVVLANVPRGRPVVLAAPGHDLAGPRSLKLDGDLANVTFTVQRFAEARGRVMLGPVSIPGASVLVVGPGGQPVASGRSASDGSFELKGLGPGAYDVLALAASAGIRGAAPLELGPGQRVDRLAFDVEPAPVVSGVVVDQTGAPVLDALVTAATPAGPAGEATTGADGAFEIFPLSVDRGALTLAVELPGPTQEERLPLVSATPFPPIELSGSPVRDLRLAVVVERAPFSGVVLDAKGGPQAGVLVRARRAGLHGFAWRELPTTRTDAEGKFTLPALPKADYDLELTTPGGVVEQRNRVASGATVTLDLPASLEGTLAGFPTRGNLVVIQGPTGSQSLMNLLVPVDRATFRLDRLPPGRYRVSAQARGHAAWAEVDLPAGGVGRIEVASRGTATVRGHVTADDGAPVAGLWCLTTGMYGPERTMTFGLHDEGVLTDGDGRFELPASAGQVLVSCAPEDRTLAAAFEPVLKEVTATAGQVLDVELQVGRVGGPDGLILR